MIRLKLSLLLLIFSCHGAFAQWNSIGSIAATVNSFYHDIAYHPQTYEPYVIFTDQNANDKASIMRYDGTQWVYFATGISTGEVSYPNIEITASGTIYIAFSDHDHNRKTTVMYKNPGGSWATYGTAGFSQGAAYEIDFYAEDLSDPNISGNAHLFISFVDAGNFTYPTPAPLTVMANDAGCSCWNLLGNRFFTDFQFDYDARFPSIVANNDLISVSYTEGVFSSSEEIYVMQIDLNASNPSWSVIGGSFVDDIDLGYVAMNINPANDELTLAYQGSNGKLLVRNFDGTSWNYIGSSNGVSAGQVSPLVDLQFHPGSGAPYVLFGDNNQNNKLSVMTFNNSTWNYVGQPGFGISLGSTHLLAFHPQTYAPLASVFDNGPLQGTIYNYLFSDGCSRVLSSNQEPIYSPVSGASSYQFEVVNPITQTSYLVTGFQGNNYMKATQIPNYEDDFTYHIRSRAYYAMLNGWSQWTEYCYITTPEQTVGDEDEEDNPNGGFGGGFNGGDQISIYPNPASGTITLGLSNQVEASNEIKLNIFSSTGQLVKTIDPSFAETDITTKLDLSDLAPGMYMISGFVSQQAVNKTFIVE